MVTKVVLSKAICDSVTYGAEGPEGRIAARQQKGSATPGNRR
jgi:hypothetical protein